MPEEFKEKRPSGEGGIPNSDLPGWEATLRNSGFSEQAIKDILEGANPEYAVRQHDPDGGKSDMAETIIKRYRRDGAKSRQTAFAVPGGYLAKDGLPISQGVG